MSGLDEVKLPARGRAVLRSFAEGAGRTHPRFAVFVGSSSRRTMAARALARHLALDLHRVDVAAVAGRYIGETEKNLGEVLARAEGLDVVLLLDEGDALLAARTEVRDAHDRYADQETNYLLQRLEAYDGTVILGVSSLELLDPELVRKVPFVVEVD